MKVHCIGKIQLTMSTEILVTSWNTTGCPTETATISSPIYITPWVPCDKGK